MIQMLIPERDTGPSMDGPRPKPRTRKQQEIDQMSSKLLDEVGEDDEITVSTITSSMESGLDNIAYTHTENEGKKDGHDVRPIPRAKEYDSTDSEMDNVSQRHVFKADMHGQRSNLHQDWARVTTTKISVQQPLPKPRSKIPPSDSEASTDTSSVLSPKTQVSQIKKEDYLIIPMPDKSQVDCAEKPIELEHMRKSKHAVPSDFIRTKPDTAIDMDVINQTEEIEMTQLNKPRSKPVEALLDTSIEINSEEQTDRGTKAMLRTDEVREIDKLKSVLSPKRGTNSPAANVLSPSKREKRRAESRTSDNKLFGVTVHFCDLLPVDPNILHPVVKVSLLNEDGTCIPHSGVFHKKSPERTQSSPVVTKSVDKKSTKKLKGKSTNTPKNEEDADNRKKKSSTEMKKSSSAKVGYKLSSKSVLPIMTQPCRLSYHLPTFAPHWNELLVFDEPFDFIVNSDSNVILFLEIMDFLPPAGPQKTSKFWNGYHGSDLGWYKIAWGFLKLVGANGTKNVNRKVRLQLFKPESIASKLRVDDMSEVYQWWKLKRRTKIDATICITVRSVAAQKQEDKMVKELLNMGQDQLNEAILDSEVQKNSKDKNREQTKRNTLEIKVPQWSRLEGQSCKIPNKVIKNLPESQVDAFNVAVSGNVYAARFSPCGLKLAAGLDTDQFHAILVFEVPTGKLVQNMRCHYGLIYDLDWKLVENVSNSASRTYLLAAASADSLVSLWELRGAQSSCKLLKKLLHPSFVYCVKFHPTKSSLVFTGCFDCAIRIWDISRASSSKTALRSVETETAPLAILTYHTSYVNCMVFDLLGNHLYTGDGSGNIVEWTTRSTGKKKTWTKDREISFKEAGKSPINSMDIHPNGNRILIHIRSNLLKIVDLSSFLVLQNCNGLVNDKLQIRSCFSPCGNLVLSGSEDGVICFWDADTGSILHFLVPEQHRNAIVTCVHYHPHDHFVAVGFASAINEPNPIAIYAYRTQRNAKLRFQTLTKLATWSSASDNAVPQLNDEDPLRENGANANGVSWGDSTEKFMMIVKKLDSALKFTKRKTGLQEGKHKEKVTQKVTSPAQVQNQRNNTPNFKVRSPVTVRSPQIVASRPSTYAHEGDVLKNYPGKSENPIESLEELVGADVRNEAGDSRQDDILVRTEGTGAFQEKSSRSNISFRSKVRQKRREKMRLMQHSDEVNI